MDHLHLGVAGIDAAHESFFALLDAAQSAQGSDFLKRFESLIKHTREHFCQEEALMRERGFYGIEEHLQEHAALLGEMEHFYEKAQKMRQFGLSYLSHYAYEKFRRHIINIDSQLAMFLKQQPNPGGG